MFFFSTIITYSEDTFVPCFCLINGIVHVLLWHHFLHSEQTTSAGQDDWVHLETQHILSTLGICDVFALSLFWHLLWQVQYLVQNLPSILHTFLIGQASFAAITKYLIFLLFLNNYFSRPFFFFIFLLLFTNLLLLFFFFFFVIFFQ